MRALFVVASGLFGVLAVLCLVKVATVVPDQPAIVRWLSAGLGFAFIAVFWEVARRRYVAKGSLEADPVLAGLSLAAVGVVVVMMLVFRATASG
ncbi:hypothetical protein [Nocardioides currus]|uniref:Uncharacterized protein n=1 Tax=Nocardioides currus TaxID=2133958 RepID=A0A2R7Z222_9ACTN|nr:hypothetical protein [Nocardioides currus]PUA82652.1 hypothetical protein C7S10_02670 [Nocardioides currus]